ncbi:carbohydrate binding domain-containing protein [Croceiramulus getboli]|nr:carbohydrate binding domain-containing protein [Flavobacteriaceae bacterium YJPT1-3]
MKKLNTRSILLLLTTFMFIPLSCEDDEVLIPQVTAGFTYTVNEDTGTVSFINISEQADDYTWDFGDGTSSTEINPIKTYTSGTYTVTLRATNLAGGANTFEDELTIVVNEPISLPITFDSEAVNYEVTTFQGAAFMIVENPDLSGTNAEASNVGEITNSGAAFEGFFINLEEGVDLSAGGSISINFWSEVPTTVLLKLEEGSAADTEVSVAHSGTGWESLVFDFSSTASYNRLTFFVDGPGTTAGTFYIDNIAQMMTEVSSGCDDEFIAATALPLDFEGCETFLSSNNFGSGITSGVAENPAKGSLNESDFVLEVEKVAGADFFAGVQNTFANNFDLSTTNTFKIKVYSTKANVPMRFELALDPQTDPVTGNPAPVFRTVETANEWVELSFSFENLPGGPTAYNQLVIKPDNNQTDGPITETGTYYFDDLRLEEAGTGGGGGSFDSGLLTNGDFEDGPNPWTIGVGTDPVPLATEDGNSFYSVNVEVAGNAFDVNMSQKLEIIEGSTYTLTFDAWSDRSRSIVAGIGLSGGSFANTTETVNIDTNRQTYTLTLTANGFGAPDARVLFDSGAEVGLVNIDNVSLFLDETTDTEAPVITLNGAATIEVMQGDTFTDPGATATDNVDGDLTSEIQVGGDTVDTTIPGTYAITYNVSDAAGNAADEVTRTVIVIDNGGGMFDSGLLTNGDFENGAAPWTIGVGTDPVPLATMDGNTYYSVDVQTAGNAFDVNMSQKLEIIEGSTYTLTFDAWSDRMRSIVAGIGLSGGSFANTTETVNIDTNRQTYSVTLTATGFGAPDARVLFDSGAEVGLVNIDNVSLFLESSGGGGSGGCTDTLVEAQTLPLGFEGCETFLAANNFGSGLTSELVENPFKTGINTSDYVLRVDKPAGSDFFAGIQNTFDPNFDLTTTNTFKVKIYSTKANVVFRFELLVLPNDGSLGNPAPQFVTIPTANEWVEVEFTFTNLPESPTTYNHLVIKPDNDQTDSPISSDGTYYIDDIRLE